ncbi:MAG: hypothetical protein V3U13_05175 [Gemmatimonadota bacterium]
MSRTIRIPPTPPLLVFLTLVILMNPSSLLAQRSSVDFLATRPMVGDIAPDFTLPTLDGNSFWLKRAYLERPVVIVFGSYT